MLLSEGVVPPDSSFLCIHDTCQFVRRIVRSIFQNQVPRMRVQKNDSNCANPPTDIVAYERTSSGFHLVSRVDRVGRARGWLCVAPNRAERGARFGRVARLVGSLDESTRASLHPCQLLGENRRSDRLVDVHSHPLGRAGHAGAPSSGARPSPPPLCTDTRPAPEVIGHRRVAGASISTV